MSSKLKATTEAGGIEGLKAKSYLSRVLFSWNSVSGAEGYDIFVKKSNGTWLYKDSTSYTNYLTGKLKLDKSYTYYIRAYYTSGGEKVYSRSSIKTVSATDTAYGQTVSGTWVEVCTETQTMYMYVNDKLYVTTPVVTGKPVSRLNQWPCQIKLLPTVAPFYDGAKLLIAADCTAYAYANMHEDFMKGKITLIGCPKLDMVDYTDKLTEIISNNDIKSVTIVRMEVPCCGGLQRAAEQALKNSGKFIPWQVVTISRDGQILD